MSQGGTGNEALASAALQAALATALVGHINERVVQPLEGRLQAQDARLDELCNDVRTFLGGGAPQPPAPSSGRTGSRQKKGSDVPQPDKMAENLMQNVVRRVLKSGCRIEHLNQAQLGLPEDELKDRIENDPPLPWRPDFLKSVNDRDNEFWVKKILDEVMKDTEGLAQVASKKIAQEFWTRECMHKRILGPMWSNVRKEVKKLVDAEAEARGKINRSKGNRGGRRKRVSTNVLMKIRLELTFCTAVQSTS
ncbi:hypothetical protein FS749_002277 [Ceratobasidium sp. UAMH 11750]|nr:hypothetical protein FS749_002277 [Ceratobasidium sp. UAMH 11750]